MKKIILMLVLFMPFKVFGSSYYTDYGFKERTDKYYEESDTLKRKEIKLYHNVKKEITYDYVEDYLCDGEIIKDDYKVERNYYSDYSPEYIPVINLRESDYKKVRYIFLYDYNMPKDIISMEVFSYGKKINTRKLDNVYDSFSGKKSYLIIDLMDIYDFKGLSINVIYDGSIETDYENFTLFFSPVGYTVPFASIYLNNFYVIKGVNNTLIEVISDEDYDRLLNSLKFSFSNREAISYFYNDVYYYGCRKENVIKSGLYSEVAKDGYELEFEDYIITYDYYERTKYEVIDVIKSKEDILNLVKGNVEVSNSNIDLSKNGIYEFYVNDRKHNVEVNIDSNNKPNLDVNVGSNNIPNVLVKEPIIEEKIIYKVLNNKNSKDNKNDNKVEVLNNKCVKTKCEVCRECNYKVYKLIIILLCLINLFLIGKNRYILTKGYK